MSNFDESKVRRGQPGNPGQFRSHEYGEPGGALTAPEAVRSAEVEELFDAEFPDEAMLAIQSISDEDAVRRWMSESAERLESRLDAAGIGPDDMTEEQAALIARAFALDTQGNDRPTESLRSFARDLRKHRAARPASLHGQRITQGELDLRNRRGDTSPLVAGYNDGYGPFAPIERELMESEIARIIHQNEQMSAADYGDDKAADALINAEWSPEAEAKITAEFGRFASENSEELATLVADYGWSHRDIASKWYLNELTGDSFEGRSRGSWVPSHKSESELEALCRRIDERRSTRSGLVDVSAVIGDDGLIYLE